MLCASCIACTNAPKHVAAPSDHFDGERFRNLVPGENRNLGHVLAWQLGKDESVPWPDWIEAPTFPPPPARVTRGIRVTFVNHATMLVQMDGTNVLTDPVWSYRVGPTSWLGPRRHKHPGIRFEDLPTIDAIVISHNHYDHCDVPTLRRVVERDMPIVIGGLGTAALLAKNDLGQAKAIDLDWWESRDVRDVRVTFAPAQHGSMRTAFDRNHTLWGSYYLRGSTGSVYFAGDTAEGPHFRMVRERLGPPTIALLPIGAYKPRWFMKPVHIDPDEAVAAHFELGARRSVGVHWGTFDQADEGFYEPVEDLERARAAARLPDDAFVALENGASITMTP